MKSTKARLYDSKELIASKNRFVLFVLKYCICKGSSLMEKKQNISHRVKHEDDIWWEVRKSEKTLDAVLVKEKDSIPKIDAVSKLHVPTTAYVKVLISSFQFFSFHFSKISSLYFTV